MMKKDILTAGLTAALGAGVVTSWCVGHGQNPLLALLITLIAGIFAAVCHQADLI
jgi:ABC-type uncharacterized transport system permease subunit